MELTLQSAKTIKGEKKGYLTGILYLSAADSSGLMNVCAYATPECKFTCLGHTSGRLVMPGPQAAQLRRTTLLHNDRPKFLETIAKDINSVISRAKKNEMIPCIRLNGCSDLPWLAQHFAKAYPYIQFYDYTKIPNPWERTLPNYHITFSRGETNMIQCMEALKNNINVAVVFSTKRGQDLPKEWNGFEVIDGDENDLRFLDKKGVVVGLRAKGKARKLPVGGFVQKGS
jgi:hypothetical protein